MKYLIALILVLGAVMLYLLSSASSNTPMFARDLPLLLFLGVALILGLMVLVGYQLLALRRRLAIGVFGSKLTLRLVLLFSLVAVLPGVLVYGVSVQFLNKSIESWFDVRVDKALEGGLRLGRTTLDTTLKELSRKAGGMASTLADTTIAQQVAVLNALREQSAVQEATLFRPDGGILAFSISDGSALVPQLLPPAVARQVRLQQPYQAVESDAERGLRLRVVVPVNRLTGDTVLLQLVQPVARDLARDAETVQGMYRDYQELSLSRQGLKRLYGLSLTLALLLALLTALMLAILFSERLSAPLSVLAAGTRAVAQGDFSQRHPVRSHDELGILTESFNAMTRQLAEARADLLRNQEQLGAAKAYLESILAKLSAGVLSFDFERCLRSANPSAEQILGAKLNPLVGLSLSEWATHARPLPDLGAAITEAIEASGSQPWERQIDLEGPSGKKVLLVRGSTLQVEGESGFVLVFDDITRLLQAQRFAAWGEVARRLAHEIKNPLTPIQLSAERLTHRLAHKLSETDGEMLTRATQTIVAQVAHLKGMVDAFTLYARMPELRLEPLDLNRLVREVLALYESQAGRIVVDLDDELPPVVGDAARLTQVIHNLLRNAQQAVVEVKRPRVTVVTQRDPAGARLAVRDNGTGFPPDILARAFEPYITTKAKGTGLGLAIVRKIVDEHSGTIAIQNVADGGAEVALVLPFAKDRVASMPATADVKTG
ncbi:MAG: PAS domain-containing sensor histidine kinase [Proteobacteria bacterium]|nr:MAG: PAS domain-containing sensor histidine kinase [Pseudomonadota bacterium]